MPPITPSQPPTPTSTKTHAPTNAKILALTVGLLTLGLAGYGFGFIPGLDQKMEYKEEYEQPPQEQTVEVIAPEQPTPPPEPITEPTPPPNPPDCREACLENHRRCLSILSAGETRAVEKCNLALQQCEARCTPPTPPPTPAIPEAEATPPTPTVTTEPPAETRASSCFLTVEHTDVIGQSEDQTRTITPNGNWQVLSEYMLNATAEEDVIIRQLGISTHGDFRNFNEIGLMQAGVVIARIPSVGLGAVRDLPFLRELRIPGGRSVNVQLVGRLAPIISMSEEPSNAAFSHSGDVVDLFIGSGNSIGMWGRGYENNYLIEAECTPSMTRVYASGSSNNSQRFIIRKSHLNLNQQPLASTTLTNGRQNVYRFQANVDTGENASLKKIVWTYNLASAGTSLRDFRLYRGANEMPLSSYRLTDQFGRDVRGLPLSSSTVDGLLVLTFTNEEIINRSGQTYALSAISQNPSISDTFQLTVLSQNQDGRSTGYLTDDGPRGAFESIPGPTIDTDTRPDGIPDAGSRVIWSDLAETSHSPRAGQDGGSRDWIAGTTDASLRQQTLAR